MTQIDHQVKGLCAVIEKNLNKNPYYIKKRRPHAPLL